MSNYDNASDEVKAAYSDGKWWGAWEERGRIISLLETARATLRSGNTNDIAKAFSLDFVIALIKGESE